MKRLILSLAFCLLSPFTAWAKLQVVTTTTDLKWLTEQVGGGLVSVESLSSGDQDLHFVEPRPSMVMKMKKADVFVKIGLDQDMWADSLVAASRNKKVVFGAPGYIDTSVGIERLQVPTNKVDAGMGDIHVFGNPHYWLDPANSAVVAKNILEGLIRNAPDEEAALRKNYTRFKTELDAKLKEWDAKAVPLKGLKLVTYHNSWVYFAKRFDMELFGNIEPKPGIPPSPAHLEKLISLMKSEGAKIIMAESFYPLKGPKMVAAKTGAKLIVVPSSVGGLPEIQSYFAVFDCVLTRLLEAQAGGKS